MAKKKYKGVSSYQRVNMWKEAKNERDKDEFYSKHELWKHSWSDGKNAPKDSPLWSGDESTRSTSERTKAKRKEYFEDW